MGRQLIDHGDNNNIGIIFAGNDKHRPGAAKWVEHSCPRCYIIGISRYLCCHGSHILNLFFILKHSLSLFLLLSWPISGLYILSFFNSSSQIDSAHLPFLPAIARLHPGRCQIHSLQSTVSSILHLSSDQLDSFSAAFLDLLHRSSRHLELQATIVP